MTIDIEILNELKAIRMVMESIIADENRNCKIPQASKKLGIGQAKLRELIKKGIIPAMKLNGDKKPQYIINVPQAMNILTRGGYMKPGNRSGRKSTLNLQN